MAISEAQYNVRADTTTNTLYIELAGRLEAEEIEVAANEATDAAQRLSDGFYIINDISQFTPPSPEAAEPIQEAQKELKSMGVGDVVRVVASDTSRVTENAFQRRSRQAGYEGKTAESVEEAEAMLGI